MWASVGSPRRAQSMSTVNPRITPRSVRRAIRSATDGPDRPTAAPRLLSEARASAASIPQGRQSELLEASRTLRRAIRLRNPYVDSLSELQVRLLARLRQARLPHGFLLNFNAPTLAQGILFERRLFHGLHRERRRHWQSYREHGGDQP